MPHLIVEHTADIDDISGLLNDLHRDLSRQDTVDINALKTRSIAIGHTVIGDGSVHSMIHITLKLLSGRADDLITKMTRDLHMIAKNHCAKNPTTRITVEAMELHGPSYQK